jgi:phospholipid transport system substrate-binding protein
MWCVATIALAAQSPVQMLQTASDQMISSLQQNKATIKTNPKYVEGLARQILLPHVDITSMAKLALGRDGWLSATPAQQQQFVTQFTTIMIRTYSSALAAYTNQKVQFYPLRGDINGKSIIEVNSKIIQSGGPAIPVNYRLILRGNEWKVFDLSVDGISMVQSFRSQFSQPLKQGGMQGLLNAMVKHNASRGQ